ncbi:MAG: hypothetical protein IPM49_15535 [Flavobacteriales bacterium]|nr:hypothetical protein [Flavobacteriales bacterium]
MRLLQQLLSDLLNHFFHDPEKPHALWGWWTIAGMLGLMSGPFWLRPGAEA